MLRFYKVVPLVFALLPCKVMCGADWSSLYEPSKVAAEKPRIQKAVDYLLSKEILITLADEQRISLGLQQIDLPLRPVAADPLGVYAKGNQVELPVPTLLFVEDLARSYGWLWANRYTTRTMDEYLAMLRYRKPEDFADHRYPQPLQALHIPANALSDKKVMEMSLGTRRTAYAFLLLHEYAHLRLYAESDAKRISAEAAEEEADAYALDLMKHNSALPTGVLLVMQSWLFFDAGNPEAEHPMTPKRLDAMAQYFELHAREFAMGRPNPANAIDVIHSISVLLKEAGEFMAIPGHQTTLQQLASKTDVDTLKPRLLPKSTK